MVRTLQEIKDKERMLTGERAHWRSALKMIIKAGGNEHYTRNALHHLRRSLGKMLNDPDSRPLSVSVQTIAGQICPWLWALGDVDESSLSAMESESPDVILGILVDGGF